MSDAKAWCDARCQRMFDLESCLFDTALIKLRVDAFAWYICQHHLISDAWGATQLWRLLCEVYGQRRVSGQEIPLEIGPEFPAAEQESINPDRTGSREHAPTEFYGRRLTRIRSDSHRLPVVVRGDKHSHQLTQLFSSAVAKSFSVELSQFNVVLTLLFAYLNRVSGQKELVVGVPFHNRMSAAARATLGMFIRLYSISVEVTPDETFRSLLKKVQIAANNYLRAATSGQPHARSNAEFNSILNFIHASFGEFDAVPVKAQWLHPGCSDRQHHLRLHVESFSAGDQPDLKIDFNCDVFDPDQRQLAIGHFQSLVAAMATDLDQQIGAVDLLSPGERDFQLNAFNATGDSSGENICARLARIADQFPGQTAISCQGSEISYRELNQRIEAVEQSLASVQLDQGDRVAICLERSVEAVVAMLAVLRSGLVFVPLDPGWPQTRIDFVIANCGAKCVLTKSTHLFESPQNVVRIDLDRDDNPVASTGAIHIDSGQTAYILYTSGSTGQPKGVEISHAGLSHYVNWAAEYYGRHKEPLSFPLFTPLTFDLTLTSIFVPLATGGKVVVYPERVESADLALLEVIKDDLVDVIKLTPSHLSLLDGRRLRSSRVRQLILGGENLKVELATKVLNNFPDGVVIHNEYGPTEATVGCIVYSFDANQRVEGPSVPIGRPISGMQAYVLNRNLQPQPAGVAGDLYVSGSGLAVGYFGQPELTAQKFVENPFRPGSRLYQTGDLARFNADGILEYLGRQDHQVKIRGARIELGAIESALAEHQDISQAIVTTFAPRSANPLLDYCSKCGLASNFPDIEFDSQLVCNHCRAFADYREKANGYFKSMAELKRLFASQARQPDSQYDCLALLSGGKDSTYMLARLAEMDLRILAFTLDNGFISDEAKANIRRVVKVLGIDHEFGSTSAMNEIFVDSLKRFSNVCQGCFKTIYTLSMNVASGKEHSFYRDRALAWPIF